MLTTKSPPPLAVLSLLLLSFASAEIKNFNFASDARPMILVERFGFTHTGHASISASAVSVASAASPPDLSLLGFFLVSDESVIQILIELEQNPNLCVLDSYYISLLFTFRCLSPPPNSSFKHSYPVISDEYSLFFANCHPDSRVSMSVRTELYNLDSGSSKVYLSVGLTALPTLLFQFSLCYFGFLVFWSYVCFINKGSVNRIHLLMVALLLMKALNLLCAAEDMHYIKVTGTPHGWDAPFYIFQFIWGVLLFTVIVLIGTGWSFLKPFLHEREKKVLMIVIPLQVMANLALIVMGETGLFVTDWVTWNQVFLLVDFTCCCATIFPIVWSIRSFHETSKTNGKAARNLAKLTLFRQFYLVVIGYLYVTRIVVSALKTIASYRYQWVANVVEELATLAFYIVIFYMFRPVEKNNYFVLDEGDESAKMALADEGFEL